MKRVFCLLFFLSVFVTSQGQSFITGFEYWIDTAYSARVAQSVIPQQRFSLQTFASTDSLSKGLHVFNIRFNQNNGFWSSTLSSYFFNTGKSSSPVAVITAFRYWIDGSDSTVTDLFNQPFSSPVTYTNSINVSWARKGTNILHTQFRDDRNNWSVATIDTFYKSANLTGSFESDDTLTCTRDTVHFLNESIDGDVYLWHFGDGDSSNDFQPVHRYQQPGDYTVSLTVSDTTLHVDTTITQTNYIYVMQSATASFTYTVTYFQVALVNTSTNAISYTWHFGDGQLSHLTNTLHNYAGNDTFTVSLMAYDSCGWVSDSQEVIIDVTLGENEFDNSGIRVYQSRSEVNILFNDTRNKKGEYYLFNSSGELILSKKLPAIRNGMRETFSIEDLASGIYFLRLIDDDGAYARRIVRE